MGKGMWASSAYCLSPKPFSWLPALITVKEGSATPGGMGTSCPKEAPVLLSSIFSSFQGSDQTVCSSVRYCQKHRTQNGNGKQPQQVAFYCFYYCARQMSAYLKPAVQSQNKRKKSRTVSSGSLTLIQVCFFSCNCKLKKFPVCQHKKTHFQPAAVPARCFLNSILLVTPNQR